MEMFVARSRPVHLTCHVTYKVSPQTLHRNFPLFSFLTKWKIIFQFWQVVGAWSVSVPGSEINKWVNSYDFLHYPFICSKGLVLVQFWKLSLLLKIHLTKDPTQASERFHTRIPVSSRILFSFHYLNQMVFTIMWKISENMWKSLSPSILHKGISKCHKLSQLT